MIVCLCRGVTEHTIRALIDAGIDTIEDLGRVCGAGTDCGGCRRSLHAMIEDACGRQPEAATTFAVCTGATR